MLVLATKPLQKLTGTDRQTYVLGGCASKNLVVFSISKMEASSFLRIHIFDCLSIMLYNLGGCRAIILQNSKKAQLWLKLWQKGRLSVRKMIEHFLEHELATIFLSLGNKENLILCGVQIYFTHLIKGKVCLYFSMIVSFTFDDPFQFFILKLSGS